MGDSLLERAVGVAISCAAVRPDKSSQPTYIGLALLAVLLVAALIKAYRIWEEIHDVEEPDSPSDLLASFEEAHAAGELDDEELERVRKRLARFASTGKHRTARPPSVEATPPPGPSPSLDRLDEPSDADDLRGDPS